MCSIESVFSELAKAACWSPAKIVSLDFERKSAITNDDNCLKFYTLFYFVFRAKSAPYVLCVPFSLYRKSELGERIEY
jgi:hypothetical protein